MIRKNNFIRWIMIIFILVVILFIINFLIGVVLISFKDIIFLFLGNDIRGNLFILENYCIFCIILVILIGLSLVVLGIIF